MGMLRGLGFGVVVGLGLLGAGAPGASAYSISGGSYVGSATYDPTFTFDGGLYAVTCPSASTTFSGTATGWPVTYFRPYYGGVDDCEFFGFPAEVKQDGSWGLTVTGGPSNGLYTGELHIPAATTTIEVPIANCTVTITGTQTFSHGVGGNIVTAFNLSGGIGVVYDVAGMSYSASSNCPFTSGTSGTITATFVASGPTIS